MKKLALRTRFSWWNDLEADSSEDHTNDNLKESNSEKNVCSGESTSTQVSIILIFKFKALGIVRLGPSPKLKPEGKR